MISRTHSIRGACTIAVLGALTLGGTSLAGSLEPDAPPAPTMKSLDSVVPVWDQTLSSTDSSLPGNCNSSRFTCVMNDEGVRDNETGLVWERQYPRTAITWDEARSRCAELTTGGRMGWRLPTLHELQSLGMVRATDPEISVNLPPSHPFTDTTTNPQGWTSTTDAEDASQAWYVLLFDNLPRARVIPKSLIAPGWCVRGPVAGASVY